MINYEEELKQSLLNISSLRRTRKAPNWKYGSFEELILDYGYFMNHKILHSIEYSLPKRCYYNCQKIAFKRKDWIYVEGYAISREIGIPLAHAWLLTPDKNIIDPTWEDSEAYYVGVPFSTKWIKSFLGQRNQKDSLAIFEGNYLEDYSLLKEGLPPNALYKGNALL